MRNDLDHDYAFHPYRPVMSILGLRTLVGMACEQTGLSDFGDPWFFGNIDALIPVLNTQAKLSPQGVSSAQGMILSALSSRLRHVNLIKKHPEILKEQVDVKAILTGLPRTGSTMLHRMLAATPNLTGIKWYETQNYVPLPGESRDNPALRREAAQDILDYMLMKIPELMSLHPMSIDQPDEEVIVLGQLFSSSMIESTYFVPDYASWLSKQNPKQAYLGLIEILKSLQWQNRARTGKSWILKTPGHLMALDVAMEVFPDAKIVMTHRDPVATVPSYCSMEASLYKIGSDDISNTEIGTYWLGRLYEWLEKFMSVRQCRGSERFIDVNYEDQLKNPKDEALQVLERIGINKSTKIEVGVECWIEANRREHRTPHKYIPENFGLTQNQIKEKFKVYRNAFLK